MNEDPAAPEPVSYHHLLMRPGENAEEARRRLTEPSVPVDEPCPWCGVLIHTTITPWAADNGFGCDACSGTMIRLGVQHSRRGAIAQYIAGGGSALLFSGFLATGVMAITVIVLRLLQDIFLGVAAHDVPMTLIFILIGLVGCCVMLSRSLLYTGPSFRAIGRVLRGRKFVASIGPALEYSPSPKLLDTRRTNETLDGALQVHTEVVGEEQRGGLSQAHEAGGLEIKDPSG